MPDLAVYDDAVWEVPRGAEPDASGQVLRRARLIRGGAGFHSHVIDCPPDTLIPPHSHNSGELMVVLEGTCVLDDRVLVPFDTLAIPAKEVYGFRAGPHGLRFMIVRTTLASLEMAE